MIMTNDDRDGCRSLVCDSNGIIIAEMVYKCMLCAYISDSICDAQKHYQMRHIENENRKESKSQTEIESNHYSNDLDDYSESIIDEELASCSAITYNLPSGLKELQKFTPINSKSLIKRTITTYPSSPVSFANTPLSLAKSKNGPNVTPSGTTRGGFVTCAVCNITKFYASVQRRYGQFTCMGCAKFFGRFLLKPRKYCCINLGNCPLDATPRCKACLLQACINTYSIDEKRMKIVNLYRPIRKLMTNRQSNSETSPPLSSSPCSSLADTPSIIKIPKNNQVKKQINQTGRSRNSNTAVLALLRSTGKKNWGCRKCAGCLVEDCGKCNYCLDKPKFGGANTLKKKCIQRKCLLQEQQKLEQAQNSLRNFN